MQSGFKDHLLEILTRLLKAVKTNNIREIKDLSNQTIHSLTIFQDELSRDIAVISYSLYKILSRSDYQQEKGWNKFYEHLIKHLTLAKEYIKNGQEQEYTKEINRIQEEIKVLKPDLQNEINNVFESSKIAKASRITEHGVSLGQAAKTLNTSQWDVQQYTGKTGISEKARIKDVKKRLEFAKSLFN